jgi:hypothetical protein
MGRCPEDTQSSALTSDKKLTSEMGLLLIVHAAAHKACFEMAGRRSRGGQELVSALFVGEAA